MSNQFTYDDIQKAYQRIRPYIYQTPLEKSMYLSNQEQSIYFKLECAQSAKSFKIRGCLNKMLSLSDEEKQKGVTTVSSGNHGICVAYGAQMLGIKHAVIIVPKNTPQSKIDKIKYFGGTVKLMGDNYDGAHKEGMAYIQTTDMTFIDSYYDDPLVYAGQGTMALEILKQNPDIDTILVPIGGGGMLTGIAVGAKAIKKDIRIIGVHTAACPALIKSYKEDKFYEECESEPSICDALIGGIGKLCFEMAKDYVDDLVAVSEESIERAVVHMINKEKFIVEPASAVCVAAFREHTERIGGKHIAMIMSGGNIDTELMLKLLNKYHK